MGLRNIKLAYEYRSDTSNLVDDFYVPCMQMASEYWRAVGFFTSSGLAVAAKGLAVFLQRQGKMRLVTSPWFTEEDVVAFEKGYQAREEIAERAVLRQLSDDILGDASALVRHRLECLAWLVAEGRLEVKVALPTISDYRYGRGIYHEKVGLFLDGEGDYIAFTGSPNETAGGLLSNFETVDVFPSWDDLHGRAKRKYEGFQRLWDNQTERLYVIDFPKAAKERLLKLAPRDRPAGTDPESIRESPSETYGATPIRIPEDIQLRWYQREAIDSWMQNGRRGFLSMATGSGKTIAALAAAAELLEKQERLCIIVGCPFQHLVDQWADEAQRFGFKPMLAYKAKDTWENEVNKRIVDFSLGTLNCVFVITTHSTFMSRPMQETIRRIKGTALLIADEAHHLGAVKGRERLPECLEYRMALSATPERWFDEEGTKALQDYFGHVAYEFSLAQAIEAGCLTQYYYRPHLVDLTEEELEDYKAITERIAPLVQQGKEPGEDEELDMLLIRRARILNEASQKLPLLEKLLRAEAEEVHHSLFYCAPGHIDDVVSLLGNTLGLRVHRFTAEETQEERQRLLRSFADGELQGLVAMKCLDEGVDVPSTQVAYILASSSNPREFIQRRGRILRKALGKEHSIVHDLITVPPAISGYDDSYWRAERSIVKRELARFKEFADASRNPYQAKEVVWSIARRYNLLNL